ncbi:beta-helix fold protein [Nitzschia inconspicua]|uniref:Beta-helix fold protein n=1 Tax=Nitzschia inconspicua TaxID=303405 RepID=A0A9K3KDU2_9STRA|nr:beta-helix fold protein [Nitzschia inconspicua]
MMRSHCAASKRSSDLLGGSSFNVTRLDCNMRQLALNYSRSILNVMAQETNMDGITLLGIVHDALQLTSLCHIEKLINTLEENPTVTTTTTSRRHLRRQESNDLEDICRNRACIFVVPSNPSSAPEESRLEDGTMEHPWTSLHRAVDHARSITTSTSSVNTSASIILRKGVHSLQGQTLHLSNIQHRNLTLMAYPEEDVWISGGLSLQNVVWKPEANGIYVANLTNLLLGHTLPKTPSLFTSTRRYYRARYPNADPEIDAVLLEENYDRHQLSLEQKLLKSRFSTWLQGKDVLEWKVPPKGTPPNFTFYDFATHPPPGVPHKNDSTMDGYNWYASGHGGVCSEIWGPEADSYWCSNASQGGWAEVDQECATTGRMQLPVGMTYNQSEDTLSPFQHATLEGGYVFAQHSQSWSMHMFEITHHSASDASMTFAKGGGKQGGRNWCRCDQCTYAGSWCGQHESPPRNDDQRLIGGNWIVENVKEFLDLPGEYFLDREKYLLYVKPNSTADLTDFSLGILTELVDLRNSTNVQIKNLGFRDQAATFLEDPWSAPSGGDWSLRRGGAIFIEGSSHVTIRGCHFFRLDGSAIFLSRRTRYVTIECNHFEWLGENAIATWGETDAYDATSENFPIYTLIQYNIMRELGIYQIQSSALGQNKAALSKVRNNIMFNMPRAAINFNDMVGGGDIVTGNLIFNTCRKSGDHGPINTWDRQAYLTTLKDGQTASFDPQPRIIRHNFIFANYGASQGVDNDDGSSWYHIHHNVFYMADGFKMDYGGHDSVFENNLILSYPYSGNCFGMGTFLRGHGDVLRSNRCILGLGQGSIETNGSNSFELVATDPPNVGRFYGACDDSHLIMSSNEYYTPDGVVNIGCNGNSFHTMKEMQEKFGLEIDSKGGKIPEDTLILEWASKLVH